MHSLRPPLGKAWAGFPVPCRGKPCPVEGGAAGENTSLCSSRPRKSCAPAVSAQLHARVICRHEACDGAKARRRRR